jgi:uroporphyrinogen-III synthase
MVPTLLLTRPRDSAEEFAKAHDWAGKVVIAPLLQIVLRPVAPPALGEGVIVTSRHGVQALAAVSARRDTALWCVGPGTWAAARAAGFDNLHMAEGTAAALLDLLRANPPDQPLVHMCGAHVVMDLCAELRSAGLSARPLVCYDQHALALCTKAQRALSEAGDVVVPVFSPRSARIFAREWHELTRPRATLHAVAISQAAVDGLSGLPLHTLRIAQTPDMQGMLAELAALQAALEPEKNPR